jgi:hypothetical protein
MLLIDGVDDTRLEPYCVLGEIDRSKVPTEAYEKFCNGITAAYAIGIAVGQFCPRLGNLEDVGMREGAVSRDAENSC